MSWSKRLFIFSGAAFFFISVPCFAQELEKIVVMASPIIESNHVDNFAFSSTEVTADQIRNLNAVDIGTALRRTPGVNISRYNPIGSFGGAEGGGIFIRGHGISRPGGEIKTFIDGVPMYMGVWNHPLLDLLSVDSAQSITVYKSPQPQVFGNAFAAINIEPKRKRTVGFETKLHLAGGSFETFIESAEHSGKTGNIDYFLGQSFRRSEGHRDNADGQLFNSFARFGITLSPNWEASFFGLYTDNFAHDPGQEGKEYATRNGKYETEAMMGVVSLAHRYDLFEGTLKVFINKGKGDWRDQRPPNRNTLSDFTFFGIRAQEKISPWENGEVLVGLDLDTVKGEVDFEKANGGKKDWRSPKQHIVSPYIGVNQIMGDKNGLYFIPSAGLRVYKHNEFDTEISPYAGVALGRKTNQFHAAYSRGVTYPGLEVVVLSEAIIQKLGKSWQNLEAEIVDHYEIGYSHAWSFARVDLNFFLDKGKNRYLIVPPPPPPPVYTNIGDFETKGMELAFHIWPADDLSVFLGATFLDSDDDKRPYTPSSTFSAGMNWCFWEKFYLTVDAQHVSSMYVTSQKRRKGPSRNIKADEYFLLNARASYKLDLSGYALEIFIAGENLTDTEYSYRPGYPMPGINAMLGLNIGF